MTVFAHLDIRLGRGLNDREHYMRKHARAKTEQSFALWTLHQAVGRGAKPELPVKVTLTRCSPSPTPLDGDNLAGSLKGTRDGVALFLGVDDGDRRIEWICAQRRERWGVDIEIEEVRDADEQALAADGTRG